MKLNAILEALIESVLSHKFNAKGRKRTAQTALSIAYLFQRKLLSQFVSKNVKFQILYKSFTCVPRASFSDRRLGRKPSNKEKRHLNFIIVSIVPNLSGPETIQNGNKLWGAISAKITSVLTFKEISLNYGNLDLFKEIFKEMVFLRKF